MNLTRFQGMTIAGLVMLCLSTRTFRSTFVHDNL
jgi:hypothetical protein